MNLFDEFLAREHAEKAALHLSALAAVGTKALASHAEVDDQLAEARGHAEELALHLAALVAGLAGMSGGRGNQRKVRQF